MLRIEEIRLPLDHEPEALRAAVAERLGVGSSALVSFKVHKRAPDSRKKSAIVLSYIVDVEVAGEKEVLARCAKDPLIRPAPDMTYKPVAGPGKALPAGEQRPVVVGFGPCGIFAALILAEAGLRPLVFERGKIVRERTVDTFKFWRQRILDPRSNVQFGEGGAGTFSDGKLYSQVRDPRHLGRKVLEEFVRAGAPDEILYVSRPHIGTFRLVSMVENIRAKIESLGGEIRFEALVTDIVIDRSGGRRSLAGLVLENGEVVETRHAVMALGHSARETFRMLHDRGVFFEAKPLSIGVRIEHPQSVIDRARYGPFAGHKLLGAADYRLSHHAQNGRTAYSFCMCPGGTVVAAASEQGRLVTNGMSQYSRQERNANAGLVVNVETTDFPGDPRADPLAGIAFQRQWEEKAFAAGGATWAAPAQLVGDFLAGTASTSLGAARPSYQPGVTPSDVARCLPDFAVEAMREAIPRFGRTLKGFDMAEAVMTAVETRTSSPVRMTRNEAGENLSVSGLFPAGEGAGYAGGILSAGIDGIKAAESVARAMMGAVRQTPLLFARPRPKTGDRLEGESGRS
jgi:hypothetical protein